MAALNSKSACGFAQGKRRLLLNTGAVALALALLPMPAMAATYTVNSEAELINAINSANADGDTNAKIMLGSSFAVSGTALPNPTKPIEINTNGFTLTGADNSSVVFNTLVGSGPLTLTGTIVGSSASSAPGSALSLNGGGATATNQGSITGGNQVTSGLDGKVGVSMVGSVTFVNNGTVTGGSLVSYSGTVYNSGAGVSIANGTLVNGANGVIEGGSSQGPGAGMGVYTNNLSNSTTILNEGTIRGGSSTDGMSAGGAAISGRGNSATTITNIGLLEGGTGAAAVSGIGTDPWNVTLINSGTIRAGAGSNNAIVFGTGVNSSVLELRAGSVIEGNVVAGGPIDRLQLGGEIDSSFGLSSIGAAAQYRGFEFYDKIGTSTWTLTGDNANGLTWNIQGGTLRTGDGNIAFGAIGNDGTIEFAGSGTVTFVGTIQGTGSVVQSGSGTTTLSSQNNLYSGGTFITGGTLVASGLYSLGPATNPLTIDGGTLRWTGANQTLSNPLTWGANGGEIDVTSSGTSVTVNQALANGGALTKSGAGSLILAQDNTYTGGTRINAGTLQIGSGGSTGSIIGDALINSGYLIFNRSTDWSYGGVISGAGNFTKTGAGTVTLTGLNTYSGITTASGGKILLSGGQINGTSGITISAGGGITVDGPGSLLNSSGTLSMATGSGDTLTVQNGGDVAVGNMTLATGLSSVGAVNVIGNGTTLTNAGTLSAGTFGALTLDVLDGAVLNTTGAATLGNGQLATSSRADITVSGTDSRWTVGGALTVRRGSLTVVDGGELSANSAVFGYATGSNANNTTADVLVAGAGSVLATSGALSLTNTAANANSPTLTIADGGTVTVGGGTFDMGTGNAALNIGGAESVAATGAGTLDADFVTTSASSRISFNHTNPLYTFGALINGAGTVNQVSGTTVLTANNSYTGATAISGGTLRINGDQSDATGLTSVLNGGTLGGSGIVGGDVVVADGGTIAPGNSPGTLTINGNLALSSGSLLDYEFGQSNVVGGPLNDLTQVKGDLTLDGTINATVTTGGEFNTGVYRVVSYDGTLIDNGLDIGTMPAGSAVSVQASVAGQVNLVNSAGANVNFWDGAAGPKLDGAVNGGNGVWQATSGNNNWTDITGTFNTGYTADSFAVFMAALGTVTVDDSLGAVTASGLQFASDGYLLTGDAITLTGTQSLIRVGDGTTVGAGFTATIDSVLTGAAQVVKSDLGTLSLTGENTYTGGTSITAGILQIGNGGTSGSVIGDIVNDAALVVDRSDDVTLGGDISGTGTLTKLGAGVFTLTGDGTYSGGTLIGAGVLRIGNGGASGSITGNIVDNAALAIDRSGTLTLAGTISGSGSVTQTGTGTTVLTGTNSYAGATDVLAGTLLVDGDQSAATGLTTVAAGATLGGTGTIGGSVDMTAGGTLSAGNGGAGTLTINGTLALGSGSTLAFDFGQADVAGGALNDLLDVKGDLTLDGTIDVAATSGGSFDVGIYRVANYGGTLTDNGLDVGTLPTGATGFVQTAVAGQVNLVNTGGQNLNFWDGGAGAKFDDQITGGDGVWQGGTGNDNWTLADGAVNAGYSDGAMAIFTGTAGTVTLDTSLGAVTASGLQFAVDGYVLTGDALTLTSAQSTIRMGDGSAAGANYVATIGSVIDGNAQLVKTGLGTLVLTGSNLYTGGTAINGGTLRIASDANLGAASGGLSLDGGTLGTSASFASSRAISLIGNGSFATDSGTALTLEGLVSGTGGLTKMGLGTLVLAADNAYTGATDVESGTLLVNGDQSAATGLTTVLASATLGGTGTIGGNVALADGATLSPGADGAGTLTIAGDLSLSSGSMLDVSFGAANVAGGGLNDLVNVGGDLTLDGTVNVSVTSGGSFDVGLYRLSNYKGTLTNNGLSLGTSPAGSDITVQTSIAGQVNLVNSAGLTLNFWDGAAGAKNNGAIDGGSGVWQASGGNDNWTEASGNINAAYTDGGFAVFGGTGGAITVDDGLGAVSASGMQFAANAYTLNGDALTLTGPTTTIRVGDGSTAGAGFTATIASALAGDTQLVKTDAGTLVLSGTNSYTGGTLIGGGTVQIATDANLGAGSGAVTLDGGTLATSTDITSSRAFDLAGAGSIATANATTFTLNGSITGTGALTKAGLGTLVLMGNSAAYSGTTTVSAGTLAVDGRLGGTLAIGAEARLEGTGHVGKVTNAGTIAPGRDDFGTLTVDGDYTGSNGKLVIEAQLGGDNSRTDLLSVTGATAGATTVMVVNRGGLGAATVNGIKIVDVAGASNGTFALAGDYTFEGDQAVIAGAYGYRLVQNGVDTPTDGDWYLRSSLLDTGGTTPETPLYQPGVPVYEAYGQTLLTLNDIGTMRQRTGDRQWMAGTDGRPSGVWGRMEGQRSRPNAVSSTTLSDVNIDIWKMELGADHVLSQRSDGASLVLGVVAGYGQASAKLSSVFGDGSIKTKGYSLGTTLSWFGPQGFYVDSRAQVTWFDSTLKSAALGKLVDGNEGRGEAYSIEVGKQSPLGGTLSITPQVQMVYSTASFDRFVDPYGASISSKLGDSLKTRWGFSLGRQAAQSHLYAVANFSYEWLDGTVADVSGAAIARQTYRLWGEFGLGGTVMLGHGISLFGEASGKTAMRDIGHSYGLKADTGLRMSF